MNDPATTSLAVSLGLLRFPPLGQTFRGRHGKPGKRFLVDSRGAGANPRLRSAIVSALRRQVDQFPQVQAIAGLAKSGMTWAAWLAWETGLPYATVLLDGPRAGGLKREVEGDIAGLATLLVDNWVNQGTSLSDAAEIVRRHGGQVRGAVAIAGSHHDSLGFQLRIAFELPALLAEAERQNLFHPQPKIRRP